MQVFYANLHTGNKNEVRVMSGLKHILQVVRVSGGVNVHLLKLFLWRTIRGLEQRLLDMLYHVVHPEPLASSCDQGTSTQEMTVVSSTAVNGQLLLSYLIAFSNTSIP